MEGFITFVVAFMLIMWAIIRFAPLLLAWWLRRKFRDIEQKETQFWQSGKSQNTQGQQHTQKKVVDKSVGEYIDFEETE